MADADPQIYANAMVRIRERCNFIQLVYANQIKFPSTDYKAELLFLHFRKVLEEIAFFTIAANKDAYSALHANFSVHWKADKILAEVKKFNANFYPIPLEQLRTDGNHHRFDIIADGYMTPDEFVTLYQVCSEVLHTRNPYKEGDRTIQAKYTVPEWVGRIQRLLSWHQAQLLSGDVWFVNIPATGDVLAYPASPTTA